MSLSSLSERTHVRAYEVLEARFARLNAIEGALGILHWDTETMMPEGSADERANQLAVLTSVAHEILTSHQTLDLLEEAEQSGTELDSWELANLREMRRKLLHAAAVPSDLIEASSRATSKAEIIWREARRTSDSARLLPYLGEVLRLRREVGRAKGDALGLSPYDALLDSYDPGLRQAKIDPLFHELRRTIPDLIQRARERQQSLSAIRPLTGPFPTDVQRRLGETLMEAVGFDFHRGRLDVSLHPFCGGSTGDVRITTRYDESDFTGALMGVLHEAGHALYEQGRPAGWLHQPVGQARGTSVHESQSLVIDMQAGRSWEFIQFLAPLVREAFGREGPAWSVDNLHRLYTRVEPGFIRVDADGVSYPAHVIIRYELEKAMIAGDLAVADLPAAFNEGVRELLGLVVPNDRLGCLQDIHWPGGGFGYFPTYTLGAIMAAQLFKAACDAESDLLSMLARGNFEPLVSWLRTEIHTRGSFLETDDLLVGATGRPLDAILFQNHLERRYIQQQSA